MASRETKAAQETPTDRALTELGRTLLAAEPMGAGGIDQVGQDIRAEVELTMADLIGDDRGEVVFFNDSGIRSLGITTDAAVIADGSAQPHVTASGADVTGYNFVTFNNGVTLYFERELDLIVHRGPGT